MDKKHIACCSGGKDSVAMIILAHIHGEPLDEIVFSEVMFDENISGEHPEHMDFIHNVLKPQCEAWGYKFTILHSEKTYLDLFNHLPVRGKNFGTGMKLGFPMAGACAVNRDCKLKPIKDFLKDKDCIEYVGIAIDEPKRLARLTGNKVSLLEKYGYTEKMAKELCKEYGLLSPTYEFTRRGGCWFCPNARLNELSRTYRKHRELIEKLVDLEKDDKIIGYCWNILTKTRITDIYNTFKNEEQMEMELWKKD